MPCLGVSFGAGPQCQREGARSTNKERDLPSITDRRRTARSDNVDSVALSQEHTGRPEEQNDEAGHRAGDTVRPEDPLSEMLGTRCVLDFGFFRIWEYLQTHGEISQGWDPGLHTSFFHVSSAPYTLRLKVILCRVFSAPGF